MGGVLSVVIYMAVVTPPFVYAFVRWRTMRGDLPVDPHLTLRVVLHMFETLGLLLFLIALTLIGDTLLQGDGIEGAHVGLVVASVVLWGLHWFGLRRLPWDRGGASRRAYRAFRALVMGAVGTFALTAFLVSSFGGELDSRVGLLSVVMLVVWGSAWTGQVLLLAREQSYAASKTDEGEIELD